MKTRTYTLKFQCIEYYIPERCRKPRQRTVTKEMSVDIRELDSSELRLAFLWHEHKWVPDQEDPVYEPVKRYFWDDRIWALADWYAKKTIEPDSEEFLDRLGIRLGLSSSSFSCCHTEEEVMKLVNLKLERTVLMDGQIYCESREPFYTVSPSYSSVSLNVESYLPDNLLKESYRADELDLALDKLKTIKRLMEEESKKEYTILGTEDPEIIKVLIPEAVRKISQEPFRKFSDLVSKNFKSELRNFIDSWIERSADQLQLPADWKDTYWNQFKKHVITEIYPSSL